jgi:hypothetical protein
METAVQMLQIAMPASEAHLGPFCEFLAAQSEYRAINLDQWTGFLRFCEEASAWPSSCNPGCLS